MMTHVHCLFYSLSLKSKYDLLKEGQAKAVMNEKAIMAKLRHPFIINLAGTYQDSDFLYMLLGIVQGGELFSLMHTPTRDGVPEAQAKFYGACIAEGLAFMHRRGFVYRDLKVRLYILCRTEPYIFAYSLCCSNLLAVLPFNLARERVDRSRWLSSDCGFRICQIRQRQNVHSVWNAFVPPARGHSQSWSQLFRRSLESWCSNIRNDCWWHAVLP